MDNPAFNFFSPNCLAFGPGKILTLPEMVSPFGRNMVLVTGKSSFSETEAWAKLEPELSAKGISLYPVAIASEPSPEDIDSAVKKNRDNHIDVVVAIGGGSVLDAGKAIAAMLTQNEGVTTFLEGVGEKEHPGTTLPFIAVPTTSGTGSEATKNAVISQPGKSGFKKSLRHNNFIPNIALVDPELTVSCPPSVTAACGMDALTQLLEAYVSIQASPLTDALCENGLKEFGRALGTSVTIDPKDIKARTRLSYGAYLSGLALANAGLGTVHGFASVIGGMSKMSHGNVCGTLVAETTKATIDLLKKETPGNPALDKYAKAARLLECCPPPTSTQAACNSLIDSLFGWTQRFNIPKLGQFEITRERVKDIAAITGQKNNPVPLPQSGLVDILLSRL